jgi:hypothetical protein
MRVARRERKRTAKMLRAEQKRESAEGGAREGG